MVTLLLLTIAAIPAQDLSVLVREGDPTPDGFAVQFLNEIRVAPGGSWISEVNSTNPNSSVDDFVYRDGAVFLSPGDPIPGLPGDTADFFVDVDHAGPGLTGYTVRATNAMDNILVLEDTAVAREGDFVPAFLGLPAGTTWSRLELIQVMPNGRVAVPGFVQIPGVAGDTTVIATLDTNANHQVTGGSVAIQQGQILADGRTAEFVFTGDNQTRMNAGGDVLWWGAAGGASVLCINDTVVAEEGMPTPDPSLNWRSFAGPEVDLNASGDWVIRARVTAFPRDVVMASTGLIARQGQPHAAYPNFTAGDFGSNTPVFIADDGTVAFYVDLSGTGSTSDDEGYVVGDQMVVREGVTQVDGMTIVDISDSARAFHYARDASALIFEGDVDDGGTIREANILVTFGPGQSYCLAEINSTGAPAAITATGTSAVTANDLTVVASGLPNGSFGFFLVSQTQAFVVMPGGSQGNLCLGGNIGRYQNQAMSSGTTGSISIPIDLTSVASPLGPFVAAPGTSLNFQAWYRDANPAVTSNFTDGVAVTLQ